MGGVQGKKEGGRGEVAVSFSSLHLCLFSILNKYSKSAFYAFRLSDLLHYLVI